MGSGGNIPDNVIKYSGHKHQKGEKELTITDNNGYAISPLLVAGYTLYVFQSF